MKTSNKNILDDKKSIVIRTNYNEIGSNESDCTQHGGNCCASGYCCNRPTRGN